MIFDLEFLNLELDAARTGIVPSSLADHPVFQAIAFHECQLDRPELNLDRFRAALHAAASHDRGRWGLDCLFDRREDLCRLTRLLSENQGEISRMMDDWLAHFISARLSPDLHCVLYAGTHDGGFNLRAEPDRLFINAGAIRNLDCFWETLAHECYHARPKTAAVLKLLQGLEEEDDYLGAVLYTTFEEGIADFIGYNGAITTPNPIFPLRSPEEGLLQLRQLLRDHAAGQLSGEDLYLTFRKTDCCYTAGVSIAAAVWQAYGIDGLDVWAIECDWKKFYGLFRSTSLGADWPNL